VITPLRHAASLSLLALLALAAPAQSGTVAETAAEIESKIAAADLTGAITDARALLGLVWDMSLEISFSEALLVAAPAAGYGVFNPRETNVFKKGESIIIYTEPVGFGYGVEDDGVWSIGFDVDLQVLTEAGEMLGDVPSVTDLKLISRYQNREFQANITYDLNGLEAGRYRLITTLRDQNSTRSGSFDTLIEIVD
jgi:hypothetical protein